MVRSLKNWNHCAFPGLCNRLRWVGLVCTDNVLLHDDRLTTVEHFSQRLLYIKDVGECLGKLVRLQSKHNNSENKLGVPVENAVKFQLNNFTTNP